MLNKHFTECPLESGKRDSQNLPMQRSQLLRLAVDGTTLLSNIGFTAKRVRQTGLPKNISQNDHKITRLLLRLAVDGTTLLAKL